MFGQIYLHCRSHRKIWVGLWGVTLMVKLMVMSMVMVKLMVMSKVMVMAMSMVMLMVVLPVDSRFGTVGLRK